MLTGIAKLEAQQKKAGEDSINRELDVEISKLKLLQASQAAKSIMYSRQQFFEYRDKPNKLLACVLAQDHLNQHFLMRGSLKMTRKLTAWKASWNY